MKIHTIEQKLTVDNRDPAESLALAELQVEFLKNEVVSLSKTIDRLKQKSASKKSKKKINPEEILTDIDQVMNIINEIEYNNLEGTSLTKILKKTQQISAEVQYKFMKTVLI